MAIYQQLTNSIRLGPAKRDELSRAVERGSKFFHEFNESRLELAFSNFDLEMKKALYEILFFLHVNDPKYAALSYMTKEVQKVGGRLQEVEVPKTANLYLEDCPAGVVGIEELSPRFQGEFLDHLKTYLQTDLPQVEGPRPIYSVASLGSIGTIGHKKTASDLDLQVQYELGPFLIDPKEMDDAQLFDMSKALIHYYGRVFGTKQKYTKEQMATQETRALLMAKGKARFRQRLPHLYRVLVAREGGKITAQEKIELLEEVIYLVNTYQKFCLKTERTRKDKLLKTRIGRIQTYVQEKYPEAEVYLFAYSNDDYRDGKHGTTLESKEASGSAYQLILNYETLMPGIQFTPMVPIHFLMPEEVNSKRVQYERLVNYLRFHCLDLYDGMKERLVDLGSTPPLTLDYMIAHSGAVYWESFKASSGNLPKALLNLLRLEMLFDPRFNISIMELVKQPDRLNRYVQDLEPVAEEPEPQEEEEEGDFFADYGIVSGAQVEQEGEIMAEADFASGLSIAYVLKAEELFPRLKEDPWWLRYKALKIGFSAANQSVPSEEERDRISSIIDLGFALHIRISDVFGPAKKNQPISHRDQVLRYLLDKAFPMSKRVQLERIFMGEVVAVSKFEWELKSLFKSSLARVNQLVEQSEGSDQTNRDEYKIWYHYYEKHFEPKPEVVTPDILSHLKVARDRLRIGYKSIQKKDNKDEKFSAEALEHLPTEVTLFQHPDFLHGVTHCLMNGYYGVFSKGTLFERHTQVELAASNMDLGKRSANQYCYITPDLVERLIERITRSFPPQDYDYRDCIYKERVITEVMVCLNLLAYGRVSVLYRDNLKVWAVEFFDHPEVESGSDGFFEAYDLLFSHHGIIKSLQTFLDQQPFRHSGEGAGKLMFWVNPNSVKTGHPATKRKQKEEDLAADFEKAALKHLKFGKKKKGA